MQSETYKIIIAVLITTILVGSGVFFWQESKIVNLKTVIEPTEESDNSITNPENNNTIEEISKIETIEIPIEDTFKYDAKNQGYYGKLVVNGYATQQETPEAFCEENCPIFTYVFFNVLSTNNKFFDDYISEQTGNSFVGERSIGLGCFENNTLWRWNHSDQFGMKKYTNTMQISTEILNSSKTNPVTLELERYLFTGGSGAPDCYSHFAVVKILN